MAAVSDGDAELLLNDLQRRESLELVSYGTRAVSLQFPNAPSPHAVSIDASYGDGNLAIELYMLPAEAERIRGVLLALAAARGIALAFAP